MASRGLRLPRSCDEVFDYRDNRNIFICCRTYRSRSAPLSTGPYLRRTRCHLPHSERNQGIIKPSCTVPHLQYRTLCTAVILGNTRSVPWSHFPKTLTEDSPSKIGVLGNVPEEGLFFAFAHEMRHDTSWVSRHICNSEGRWRAAEFEESGAELLTWEFLSAWRGTFFGVRQKKYTE